MEGDFDRMPADFFYSADASDLDTYQKRKAGHFKDLLLFVFKTRFSHEKKRKFFVCHKFSLSRLHQISIIFIHVPEHGLPFWELLLVGKNFC